MTRSDIVAHIKGVFPPVVTPFNRRGDVDEGGFRANIRRYTGIGLSGILIAGSTGEAPYLTARERLRLVEIARPLVRAPELIVVGTGLESTRETVRLSREAIARGADVVLVISPNYFKSRMDSPTLEAHFRAVADDVSRPVIIYHIPQFTGIRMDPRALARLARHPNIAGVKESSGDLAFLRSVLRAVPAGFRVLVGAAGIFLEGLRAGGAGGVLGQADFTPEICVGLYEAFRRKQLKTARELQARLMPLVRQIALAYGVPGIKAACDLCGYTGGNPRPPLQPLGAAARRAVAAALEEARAGLEA